MPPPAVGIWHSTWTSVSGREWFSKGRNSEADYDATARRLLVAHLQRKHGSHSVIKPVTLESCNRLDRVGLDCLCKCAVLCCCLLADKTRLHFYCHWALTPSLSRRKRWTFVYWPDRPPMPCRARTIRTGSWSLLMTKIDPDRTNSHAWMGAAYLAASPSCFHIGNGISI